MPNQLQLNGAQPQKPVKFSSIYSGRWSSGLWTNRSPLRDANTTRLVEKFYGPAGDALIAGLNTEITNRLTLARRPGNSVFDSNSYTGVDHFDEFHLFSPNEEQIKLMIDQSNVLYSLSNGTRTTVWTKGLGAGQTFMQGVGNTLYFGDGVENKKWLQSLNTWSANTQWNTSTTPFMETFLIDSNGNIQQLTGCVIPIVSVQVTSNIATITSSVTLDNILTNGLQIQFPNNMVAPFLNGQLATIQSVAGVTFTVATLFQADYTNTAETPNISGTILSGGMPISGSTQPTWSTVALVPGLGDPTQPITIDGTVQWTNRGNPVKNWGIDPPEVAPSAALLNYKFAWVKNTVYSLAGVVIDTNGNLQQVSTAGISGANTPTWNTTLGLTTVDGSVVWTMIDSAAPISQPTCATPTFSPTGGTYAGTQTVTISSTTTAATIYYTTDGSLPTHSAILYTGPVTVSTSQTLNAIATKSSFNDSAVGSASYTIGTQTAPPTFSPAAGTYSTTQSVTLSCATVGATIYYTLDGSTPTTSSTVFSSPISVSATLTINAMAQASGLTQSTVASATYVIGSTGGGGYGGGSGGSGGNGDICFTGNCEIDTPTGLKAFHSFPIGQPFEIFNQTGKHVAILLIRHYEGEMIEIEENKLVTLDHTMEIDGSITAKEKYKNKKLVMFSGLVYNIHILSNNPMDLHYRLWNGDIAHNRCTL